MEIVIIGQNEGKWVDKIINSLSPYGKIHYIADRCSDDTLEKLKKYPYVHVVKTNDKLQGRQTSYCRNLGLAQTFMDSDVLFIDGDRYIVSGNLHDLKNWTKDIALLKLENDTREDIKNYNDVYGTVNNAFWSCGIFFKRGAIDKILRFQEGTVFNEDIQKDWGIEDTYLGDVCYHLNLTCDFFEDCKLRGGFDKLRLDNISVLGTRLKLRDKLKVRWD